MYRKLPKQAKKDVYRYVKLLRATTHTVQEYPTHAFDSVGSKYIHRQWEMLGLKVYKNLRVFLHNGS